MSFIGKTWKLRNTKKEMNLIDKMLENRNLLTEEERYSFFNYSLSRLYDPFLLKDMQKAVERIQEAIKKEEKIMIFGDYDVDGTSATAILYDFFQKVGANIHYCLPNRETDGYGLKDYFIHRFKEEKVDLIITVDCGTANVKEVEIANQLGMTVIVTDHHDVPEELPKPFALINPRQKDCSYPNKHLSGSAVAYKLICALVPHYFEPMIAEKYLYDQMGLAVLGLVADCMDLVGENRVLTNNGLKSLAQGNHKGVKALLDAAGIKGEEITSTTIGFFIGPHINAAGRLDSAEHALQLLLGNIDKVPVLLELNQKRRQIVENFVKEATEQIQKLDELPAIIVVSSPHWNAGTLGLIAGRMCEKFNRPVIAMQEKENEFAASCRSLNDFDITAFLRQEAGELFINVGGHMLAGGFSLAKENKEELERRIREKAPLYINLKEFKGNLELEGEIEAEEVSFSTSGKLTKFEPFGIGNPAPTLILKDIKIPKVDQMGKNKEHLRFPVQKGPHQFNAIAFRFAEHLDKIQPDKSYDLAFTLEVNEWQGNKRLQLRVVDLKISNG